MRRDYLLYLTPSVLRGVVSMTLLVPVTTYFLEPIDFGVSAILIAIGSTVGALGTLGSAWTLGGGYLKKGKEQQAELLFNVLLFGFILRTSLLVLLFLFDESVLPVVIEDFRPEYLDYFELVLASVWISALNPVVLFLCTIRQQAKWYSSLALVNFITSVSVTIIGLRVFGLGVEALFWAMLLGNAITFVLEIFYLRGLVKVKFRVDLLKEIIVTFRHSVPGNISELAVNFFDKYFIQHCAGLSALGIYGHSQQYKSIFNMLTSALSNSLTSPALRLYSQKGGEDEVTRPMSLWYRMLAMLGVSVALFSNELIDFLTHGKFTAASPLMIMWFLTMVIVSYGIPPALFLMAHKRTKVLMYSQMIPMMVGIGLMWLGAYWGGALGVALSFILMNVAVQTVRRVIAARLGYRGVAEKDFIISLGMFFLFWATDSALGLQFPAELFIYLISMCLYAWSSGLFREAGQMLMAM